MISGESIRKELFLCKDEEYAKFQRKLIPTIDPESIIGVRTPKLRTIAKRMKEEEGVEKFLEDLPHLYFEENLLHGFIIAEIKDMDLCVKHVDKYLPYVNNWAGCDQLNPHIFKENKEKLLGKIPLWISEKNVYNVRFGVKMLMDHFLEEKFSQEYLTWVAEIQREEYYIKMMAAWYFATALAKQYDLTLPYIKEKKLNSWIHNKTIQKAIESRRLSLEQKQELKQYRKN